MPTTTTNYGLKKIDLTDSPPDITVLNTNFDTIDAALKANTDVVLTAKAGGTATGITLTLPTLVDGLTKTFVASLSNGGSATTVNSVPLYKANTTSPPTIIAGKAYTIWYSASNACFFLKASAEGDAIAANVLAGKTFSNDSDTGLVGTMTNQGAKVLTPATVNVPITAGYHNGSGYVQGDADLVSANIKSGITIFGVSGNSNVVDTSAGDAVAADILSGKKAYVDGALVTGNIPSKAAATITPGTTDQIIAAGQYLSGVQTISGDADLVAANIKYGVDVFGVTGTAPVITIGATESYIVNTGETIEEGSAVDFVGNKVQNSQNHRRFNVNTPVTVSTNTNQIPECCAQIDDTHFLVLYKEGSNQIYGVIATVSGTSVSYGTPVSIQTGYVYNGSLKIFSSTLAIFSFYISNYCYIKAISLSGASITGTGAYVQVGSATNAGQPSICRTSDTTGFIGCISGVIGFSVDGITITKGTISAPTYSVPYGSVCLHLLTPTTMLAFYQGYSGGYHVVAQVITFSGTSILSWGSIKIVANGVQSGFNSQGLIGLDATHAIAVYALYDNPWKMYYSLLTVSGTNVTTATTPVLVGDYGVETTQDRNLLAVRTDSHNGLIAFKDKITSYTHVLPVHYDGINVSLGIDTIIESSAFDSGLSIAGCEGNMASLILNRNASDYCRACLIDINLFANGIALTGGTAGNSIMVRHF